ncbi:uncharacterized protein LOC144371601 isoform X2 [Ictidomys tridecemlineatus]
MGCGWRRCLFEGGTLGLLWELCSLHFLAVHFVALPFQYGFSIQDWTSLTPYTETSEHFLLCAGCVAIQQFNGSTDQQELEDDPKIVVPLCTALRGPQFLADTTSFFFVCGAEDQTRAAHMPDSLTNVEN